MRNAASITLGAYPRFARVRYGAELELIAARAQSIGSASTKFSPLIKRDANRARI
jgi:hypothetical protein